MKLHRHARAKTKLSWIPALITLSCLALNGATALAFGTADEFVNTQVLGTIDYQGGFQQDATVEFPQPLAITTFSVEVPAFCREVEVLEATYTGLRGPVRAVPVQGSRNTFSIPAGTPVTALMVTLNGPLNQVCTIPVMTADDPSTDPSNPPPTVPSELDGVYSGTRNVHMEIAQGRVIRHNFIYQSAGVMDPSIVHFTSPFVADPYLNGRWDARAYSDQVLRSPVTTEWMVCRIPLAFRIVATPGAPHIYSISVTGPASVGVDMFNRCFINGSRIDSATIQRMP